ncbi:MAG TPA: neutral zinc metallopeptidase [Trichococcus flocculiformis]|nr:neutral zinc metallopeptidase [Trichococcus flocculiformis]
MKWKGGRRSSNVEDRRGSGGFSTGGGGLGMSGMAGGGIFGIIIMIIIALFGGGDLFGGGGGSAPSETPQTGMIIIALFGGGDLFGGGGSTPTETPQTGITETSNKTEDEMAEFVSVVLAYTEDAWTQEFANNNMEYVEPTLVLFSGQVQSACGVAGSQVGPFYCPADQKLYIDLSFYDQLSQEYGASGDFAMAYVVAHEVGHHVQNLLGIMDQVQGYRGQVSETEYNELNVRLELQADYLAGVWANYVQEQGVLEAGDFEEALTAAHAVGDDTLQKQYQGYVVPDSFTHGTSEQRMRWFTKGFETGDLSGGDTFNIGYDEL